MTATTPETDVPDTAPALRMEAVRKIYPAGDGEVVALDHAYLVVGAAEIVALVGPSGSGKTTLCSIAGGLLAPTAGTVTVGRTSPGTPPASSPSSGGRRSGSCSRPSTWCRPSPLARTSWW